MVETEYRNNSSPKFKMNFNIALLVFLFGGIILFAGLIFMNRLSSKPASDTSKDQKTPANEVNVSKVAPKLLESYTTANASAQGKITAIKLAERELVIEQTLNEKKVTNTVFVTTDALIYERPFKPEANLKMIAFNKLTKGQYVSVSGKEQAKNVIDASVVTVDPIDSGDYVPPRPRPTK